MVRPEVIHKERLLDFPGKVFVNKGAQVKPQDIIATTLYTMRRPFIVEVAEWLHIAPQDVRKYMLKKEGDEVKESEVLARRRELIEVLIRTSPVEGVIETVSETSGHVVIREKEIDLTPRTVNVAGPLGIKPKLLLRYLKKNVGDYVEKGGVIAELPLGVFTKNCKSPIYGQIKSINTETGEVVVQRPHQKADLKAGIPGEVEKVIPEYGAIIKIKGFQIYGIIGFGREAFGKLYILEKNEEPLQDKILVSNRNLKADEIKKFKDKGVKGIILPSIRATDAEELFGKEVYSGVTGKVDLGITLVIINGFGIEELKEEYLTVFESSIGHWAYLDGRTQIRAGVIRPEIIIQHG